MNKNFYPSLMCVDFSRLKEEIAALERSRIAGYHIDIMDGSFVPNFALGANDIKAVGALSDKGLDLHLMVQNTDQAIGCFLPLPSQRIAVHIESTVHHDRVLSSIRSAGKKAGIALNPGTPLAGAEQLLDAVDFVLVMSVNPGFAGQKYIPYVTEKIKRLAGMRKERGLSFEIEVDGSMSPEKIAELSKLGVEGFVLGTASLFGKGEDYASTVERLHSL